MDKRKIKKGVSLYLDRTFKNFSCEQNIKVNNSVFFTSKSKKLLGFNFSTGHLVIDYNFLSTLRSIFQITDDEIILSISEFLETKKIKINVKGSTAFSLDF